MTKSDLYFNRIQMLRARMLANRGNYKVLRAEMDKAYAAWDVYSHELLARAKLVLAAGQPS
jgi:FMN-dependent NADH-azoreductase